MNEQIRRDLTELAVKAGSVLNLVIDDNERSEQLAHFRTVMTAELMAGDINRRQMEPLWAHLNEGSMGVL